MALENRICRGLPGLSEFRFGCAYAVAPFIEFASAAGRRAAGIGERRL